MPAYALALRERVVADREAGLQTAEVARKYRVSAAWVRRLMQRYRASGQVAPKRRTPVECGQMSATEKIAQVRGGAHKGFGCLFHMRVTRPSLPISCRYFAIQPLPLLSRILVALKTHA